MDKNEIRELMRFFDKSDITKLKIKEGDFSIELQKGYESGVSYAPVVSAAPQVVASAPVAPTQAPSASAPVAPLVAKEGIFIKSPMVGTFYKCPSPGAPAFASVGQVIKKGQSIGIIEAMKIMNPLEATQSGVVAEILVEDGDVVQFGQPIIRYQA